VRRSAQSSNNKSALGAQRDYTKKKADKLQPMPPEPEPEPEPEYVPPLWGQPKPKDAPKIGFGDMSGPPGAFKRP
jgi:hypothetical protein